MPRPPPDLLLLALLVGPASAASAGAAVAAAAPDEVVDLKWRVPGRRLAGGGGSPEEIEVSFAADGAQFELLLRRNRALLPYGAKHLLQHADGSVEPGPMPNACFYLGDVAGDPWGSAGISACGGGGVSGVVLAHGRVLAVEPLGEESAAGPFAAAASGGARHVFRRISDAKLLDFQADVARFVSGPRGGLGAIPVNGSGARRLTGSATKYVEVLAVNDYRRFQAFGGTSGLARLASHTVSALNAVSAIYRNPPANNAAFPYKIQVVLVGQQTLVGGDPWEAKVKLVNNGQETECSSLLQLFHEWGQSQGSALPSYDNRILLSGRTFDRPTIGLAGVSTMCVQADSGSVVMCGAASGDVAMCAATAAHEMGHNFGMRHDSDGNVCASSGLVMAAVADGSSASTQFSSCSVTYVNTFFSSAYIENGQCLENAPTRVEGDPICGNSFVERGEDCDCGSSDCSRTDPCCNGATCKFASAGYQCSASAGACCASCMFVAASARVTCRAQRNSCDLPELCPGGTAECPADQSVYPGAACTVDGYQGLCYAGQCESLQRTCSVEAPRSFGGNWDLTERCALLDDSCQQLVCHNASAAQDYICGQYFATHGKQMTVPDGSPCWFPGSLLNVRSGMCRAGLCVLPHALAAVPKCGNGGIDFGEQCDCGTALTDACCNCTTCQLKPGMRCAASEPCCDGSCQFKATGTVCRAAAGSCDVAEVCSGTSGVCPPDVGKKWGTACVASDGNASTCYGKACLASLHQQCRDKTGTLPFGDYNTDGKTPGSYNLCTALSCCQTCQQLTGNYRIDGVAVKDPYFCNNCERREAYTQFTVDGQTNTIYLGAPLDGTILTDATKVCLGAVAVTPNSTCSTGFFLEASVGRCLPCDSACSACRGPTNLDCVGGCNFGAPDARGACAISPEQCALTNCSGASTAPSPSPMPGLSPTPSPTPPGPSPTPAPTPPGPSPTPSPTPAPGGPSPSATPPGPTPMPTTAAPAGPSPIPTTTGLVSPPSPTTTTPAGPSPTPTQATTTGPPQPQLVEFSLRVEAVNYSALVLQRQLLVDFEAAVRASVAASASVPVASVALQLSAGSVVVRATITAPAGVAAAAVVGSLSSAKDQLSSAVVAAVSSLAGIAAVTAGNITVTGITEPVVATRTTTATTTSSLVLNASGTGSLSRSALRVTVAAALLGSLQSTP